MHPEPIPLESLQQIDRICDSFEAAWTAGLKPRIEDYLSISEFDHSARLFQELLAREIELRKQAGEDPAATDYEGRFAEHLDLIRSILDGTEPIDETLFPETLSTVADDDVTHSDDLEPTVAIAAPTRATLGAAELPASLPAAPLPRQIGRYHPVRLLGQGNFLVYLAIDEADGREVAIKVPRPDNPHSHRRLMSLAEEARRLAAVDHPGIVKAFEFVAPVPGSNGEGTGDGFIVLEYVAGSTLEELLGGGRLEPLRLSRIVAAVADALHHAHTFGLVHRDLKPSNILLDLRDRPKICDFGLAIDEEIQRLRRGEVAGTLPYMAPEQVRGETNRLDGRTDIWAAGVILYRGLTGRLPFRGQTTAECFDEILRCEPRPPRQFSDTIPRELERICLRCLSRQMSDRYLTAADLGDDLKQWLTTAVGDSAELPMLPPAVPKGLRSFSSEDAGFFLALLPGPWGSSGLPESIRFWKSRIETARGECSFNVGLVYGVSGGGKSSFVRAGLIPHLDRQRVRPIVLDANPGTTESRLLAELRRAAPLLPGDCDLADAVALVRDDPRLRPREKLLLVLDQFEQWLQSRPIDPDALLIRALRQCDGLHVQALLLVRDDFWMAATRLFRVLDLPLIEGTSAMGVELFDARHARKVLEEFGRSLDQIPRGEIIPGSEPDQFLTVAVSGLTGTDGRIVPVRLSLLVEVVRHRPWTLQTLETLGGIEGIGIKFLEQAFDSPSAPPACRLHRVAAEAVLKLLLPAQSSVIRGAPRSRQALCEAAGYANRPGDFADLLQVLNYDLRLIVPVEAQSCGNLVADDDAEAFPGAAGLCYQLAHDYLIRPIRHWLERHQLATREGRAHLRLEAVAAGWAQNPGAHRLPSLLEYAGIILYTRRSSWNTQERLVMDATTRHFLIRFFILAFLLLALLFGSRELWSYFERQDLLSTALAADDRQLPAIINRLEPFRDRVIAPLEVQEQTMPPGDHSRDVAGMLLYRFAPSASRGRYLQRLLMGSADPDRVELVSRCLASQRTHAGLNALRQVLADGNASPAYRLRAACALAIIDPNRLEKLDDATPALVSALLEERTRQIPGWLRLLRPVQARLIPTLTKTCADPTLDSVTRATAAETLSVILTQLRDSVSLAEAVVNSQPDASTILLRELASRGTTFPAIRYFTDVLDQRVDDLADENSKNALAARSAMAAIGLEALGDAEAVASLLRQSGPDPRARSMLIQKQATLGTGRPLFLDLLAQPGLNPAERQGLLLIWAECQLGRVSETVRGRLATLAETLFRDDPDAGVHAAAELLLRRLNRADLVDQAEQALRRHPPNDGRAWFIGPQGHTFTIISGPLLFTMGSPDAKNDPPQTAERLHYRRIDRSFAIATKEVSIAQFRKFRPGAAPDNHFTHDLRCPINGVKWYDAAQYCNRLSQRDGIPREQWCYPEKIEPGMVLPEGSVDRTGYRLPTEAEWEYACRAGTLTCRFFGSSEELLPRHGWTWLNSHDRAMPAGQLLPNPLGMFDMLGNLWEWCQDGPEGHAQDPTPYPAGTTPEHPVIDRVNRQIVDIATYRILRGGAFDYSPAQARASYRYAVNANYVEGAYGFRVVRTLPAAKH